MADLLKKVSFLLYMFGGIKFALAGFLGEAGALAVVASIVTGVIAVIAAFGFQKIGRAWPEQS